MFVLAIVGFAWGLSAEPHFVDEAAYLSQTYFFNLCIQGRFDDPGWLEYPAYDLPPLPKYLIGAALRVAGYPAHGPAEARQWYRDTSSWFDPPGAVYAARWPSVLLGAAGCVALFVLGTLVGDARLGSVAALLLIANPLYRLHARRAMSDVPAEAFIVIALAAALWCWRRALSRPLGVSGFLCTGVAGLAAGLAPLSKLNGALAGLVIAAWAFLGLLLPRVPLARRLSFAFCAVAMAGVAGTTFVALNPFLTAHPKQAISPSLASFDRLDLGRRVLYLIEHRMSVSRDQKRLFPRNAVRGAGDKLAVLAVQGFGRFGPLGPVHSDSSRRFDVAQDWGALLWLPTVLAGSFVLYRRGLAQARSGGAPTAWAFLAQMAVSIGVVAAYLPLAWDRYFLSIQPVAALAAAACLLAIAEALTPRAARPVAGD